MIAKGPQNNRLYPQRSLTSMPLYVHVINKWTCCKILETVPKQNVGTPGLLTSPALGVRATGRVTDTLSHGVCLSLCLPDQYGSMPYGCQYGSKSLYSNSNEITLASDNPCLDVGFIPNGDSPQTTRSLPTDRLHSRGDFCVTFPLCALSSP